MIKTNFFSAIPLLQNEVLFKLNSCDSAEKLTGMVHKWDTEKVFCIGDARRILHRRTELTGFKNLLQVAVVPRIGVKKFNSIVRALSS